MSVALREPGPIIEHDVAKAVFTFLKSFIPGVEDVVSFADSSDAFCVEDLLTVQNLGDQELCEVVIRAVANGHFLTLVLKEVAGHVGGKFPVLVVEFCHRNTNLLGITNGLRFVGTLLGFQNRGCRQSRKDGNNRNHHEEFHQGEALSHLFFCQFHFSVYGCLRVSPPVFYPEVSNCPSLRVKVDLVVATAR